MIYIELLTLVAEAGLISSVFLALTSGAFRFMRYTKDYLKGYVWTPQ